MEPKQVQGVPPRRMQRCPMLTNQVDGGGSQGSPAGRLDAVRGCPGRKPRNPVAPWRRHARKRGENRPNKGPNGRDSGGVRRDSHNAGSPPSVPSAAPREYQNPPDLTRGGFPDAAHI